MALEVAGPEGATPLTREELEQLRLAHVQTRQQLNEAEELNILAAARWLKTARPKKLLSQEHLHKVHARMFGEVWSWAGKTRRSNKTIGIDAYLIPVWTRELLDNVLYWVENQTYSLDEIAARYHHGLVFIHPFSDGNGRHARLIADDFLRRNGSDTFSWGSGTLRWRSECRSHYLAALRAADKHDFKPLIDFVRT